MVGVVSLVCDGSRLRYQNLISPQPSIVELLAGPDTEDIKFETPRSRDAARPVDLT